MAWIESHTTLREHPKTKRLCRLLGINRREAIGLLHILWWWVLDFAPEGDLSDFSDEDVADSIDWEGDAHELMAGLIESGFIDTDRQVHDWDEFAEKWIARRRANAERMRLARASRKNGHDSKGSEHVADTCDARAPQKSKSVGLPDQPDQPTNRTGTTPQPPPQAEGERPKRRRRRDEPVAETIAPLADDDQVRWAEALAHMQRYVLPSLYRGVVSRLTPVGRGEDGGLRLRAPPTIVGDARGMVETVGRALEQAGDAAGSRAAIVG